MEIRELPKTDTENLTEGQRTDLFNSIVLGKDATEKIETSRGVFEVKFPRLKDLEAISRLTAMRLKGLPVESFSAGAYGLIQQIAYLDIVVVSGPAWFENAKKEVQDFSFEEIPSQNFLQEVYAKALSFQFKVQEMLEPKQDGKEGNGQNPGTDDKDSSGAGVFDGLSGQR
jgi:hypothetical protein